MEKLKQKLWINLDEEKDDLIELLCQLIRIPSENPPGDMDEIMDFMEKYLNNYGIECKRLRAGEDKPYSLVAKIGNDQGPCIILNGHADVVPAGKHENWDFPPFCGEVKDGKVLGRGASDMKGGLAGALYAITRLKPYLEKLGGSIVFSVVPDEEVMGLWGTKWLVESGNLKGDACIVAEPTSRGDIEVGQKGSIWIKVKAIGTPAHGSLSPYVGDNAITKLLSFIKRVDEVREMKPQLSEKIKSVMADSKELAKELLQIEGAESVLDHVTVNVGLIRGGRKLNMVPDEAEVELDIRIPIGIKVQDVIEKIESLITETIGKDGSMEVTWCSEANNTDTQERIVQVVANNIEEILNKPATKTYQWASSDARYFRYKGIPTIQHGPANLEGIHSYNETVDVEDLISATKVYIGSIIDFMTENKS